MNSNNKIVFPNVTLMWSYLVTPQVEGDYASGKYQVDIVISDEDKAKLDSFTISSKQKFKKTDDGWQICVKSKKKPKVVDTAKKELSDEVISKIGNGTKAVVSLNIFNTRGQNFVGLGQVMIKELVEYGGGDDFADIPAETSGDTEDPFDTDEVLS
jgi:hypothetical protein